VEHTASIFRESYDIITQKLNVDIFTAIRTSNLEYNVFFNSGVEGDIFTAGPTKQPLFNPFHNIILRL
jgi:hypothetical protein